MKNIIRVFLICVAALLLCFSLLGGILLMAGEIPFDGKVVGSIVIMLASSLLFYIIAT